MLGSKSRIIPLFWRYVLSRFNKQSLSGNVWQRLAMIFKEMAQNLLDTDF